MMALTNTAMLLMLAALSAPEWIAYADEERYVNDWAVRVRGGPLAAEQLARELGYHNLGAVSTRQTTCLLLHPFPKTLA